MSPRENDDNSHAKLPGSLSAPSLKAPPRSFRPHVKTSTESPEALKRAQALIEITEFLALEHLEVLPAVWTGMGAVTEKY